MQGTKKREDRCFVELLYQMLIEIPDCEEKAMAMLQIQQMLVCLRYRSRQSGAPAPAPVPAAFGQTYPPFMNNKNQTPSPASVTSLCSEPPMNGGMYHRMVNEEPW